MTLGGINLFPETRQHVGEGESETVARSPCLGTYISYLGVLSGANPTPYIPPS